ncbi:MAG: hypothetical protein LBR15_09050 [Methanobrevibacter sp.]|nr:hypothetical protein [Candidatus Methanovirga australis]
METTQENESINLIMNYWQEYNFGLELLSAIISNTVSMIFIIIAASITFYLKKYLFKLCCCKDNNELNDQIDKALRTISHGIDLNIGNNIDNIEVKDNVEDTIEDNIP